MAEWAPTALSAVIPGISFRFLQPHFRLPFHAASTRMLRLLRIPVERVNTRIENVDPFTKQQLRKLCAMPRMSTFAMGVLINRLVTQMAEDEAYVNVGVWHGFTYFAGALSNGGKQCIAVDNYSSADRFSGQKGIKRLLDYYPRKAKIEAARAAFRRRMARWGGEHHRLFEMDYREYFQYVHEAPIGVYFYDGDHSYENQLQGLKLAEPFFSKNCVVIVDDCNDEAVYRATRDFIDQSHNSYAILLFQRTCCDRHPTLWNGTMVFQRVPRPHPVPF